MISTLVGMFGDDYKGFWLLYILVMVLIVGPVSESLKKN
jgi:hypothetical protein